MEQRDKPSRPGTTDRIGMRLFCIALLFMSHAALAEAQTPAGTLGSRLNAANPGASIQLGETIIFGDTEQAISLTKAGLTLRGGASGNFAGKISNLSGLIAGQGSGITLGSFQTAVSNWKAGASYAGSIARGTLSGIVGGGSVSGRDTTHTAADSNKWLTTPSGASASAANGFGLQDLRFGDVNVTYTSGRYVNGLIGNDNDASARTTMGGITGNVFNAINVTLKSNADTDYLAGGGVVGVRSTAGTAEIDRVSGNIFDNITILTTNSGGADAAVGFNGVGAYLEGGGLVGVNGVSSPGTPAGHASLGELSNNFFTRIKIGSNDILLGGGLVGINNNSQDSTDATHSSLGTARGNVFGSGAENDITVTLDDSLRGGGVIGLNGLSNAAVNLTNLENNAFAGISVATGSYLKGGGIVGLQTNAVASHPDDDKPGLGESGLSPAMATLGTASGNLFLKQSISAENYIEGGGVIGLRSNLGAANLGRLENNIFSDIEVTTTAMTAYLHGGGIVGIHGQSDLSNRTTTLETASGNMFLNQRITAGAEIQGGGVIGLRSNLGVANLGSLTGNVFKGIEVMTGEAEILSGGGVVGLSAATDALTGEIRNNFFDDITVNVGRLDGDALIGNYLNGGGIIGVHARDVSNTVLNWATIEGLDHNSFTNATVLAMSINGGGIVGVNAGGAPNSTGNTAGGLAALGNVTNNVFDHLYIKTENGGDDTGHLEGGGVLGVWNKNDPNDSTGISSIDVVDNNAFTNNTVEAGTYLQGGGIIGMRGSALENIGQVTRNVFAQNTVTAGSYIDGGGIIGVTNRDGTNPVTGIELIGESIFTGNTVEADGDVLGGIVYSYGLNNVNNGAGMTIRNSQFIDNDLRSGSTVYGAVTVDTGSNPLQGSTGGTLTLTATPGNSTVFRDNRIADDLSPDTGLPKTRTNSLYFGTIHEPGSNGNDDPAEWAPKLVVDPQAGGVVALFDPIWVNQADPDTTDDATDHSFTMDVQGAGDFIWGGTNVFTLDTASASGETGTSGTVTLKSGSATTLLDGSSTTTFVNGERIQGSHVTTMILNAPNFKFSLDPGATLNVEGHNRFDLSGAAGTAFSGSDPRGDTVADLKGNLHFNVNNTSVYHRGDVPANHADAAYQPLLTIKVPAGGAEKVSVDGSVVSLSNFAAGPKLKSGDRFYLVGLDNDVNDGSQQVFTPGNPSNDTAYARQGMLTRYTFTVDKNLDNLGQEENTRFLVARLKSTEPAPEFDSPHTGRVTGVTVLQRVSDRLPELEFFGFPAEEPYVLLDPCDPCNGLETLEARCDPSNWMWAGFADVRGSLYSTDVGGGHSADIRAAHYLGGIAGGRQLDNGTLQLGLFVDGSNARYDTHNRVHLPEGATTIRGEGEIDTVGGGAFLRRNWDNGFGVDFMVRGGTLENRFSSDDIITNGMPASYEMDTPYFGAGVGLNYEWSYDKNTFDVYGRYSWLRENGGNVRLSTDEVVDFEALDSQRIIAGTRWTRHMDNNMSWYVGAAYERELDGSSRAAERSNGGDLVFDGVSLRGDTGIGQIGLTLNPRDDFSITLGLEGYVGRREGGSGFLSAVYTW